jgi:hypothetical protein
MSYVPPAVELLVDDARVPNDGDDNGNGNGNGDEDATVTVTVGVDVGATVVMLCVNDTAGNASALIDVTTSCDGVITLNLAMPQ